VPKVPVLYDGVRQYDDIAAEERAGMVDTVLTVVVWRMMVRPVAAPTRVMAESAL
jgi:hypothetical protein